MTEVSSSPSSLMSPLDKERFWSKVVKTDSCWLWRGRESGYISFYLNGSYYYVHRLAYELVVGPIPLGLILDHLCRTPSCCNPDHLEPVTYKENARRGIKGILTTHCPHGHEYDSTNTYLDSQGKRHCRSCWQEKNSGITSGWKLSAETKLKMSEARKRYWDDRRGY